MIMDNNNKFDSDRFEESLRQNGVSKNDSLFNEDKVKALKEESKILGRSLFSATKGIGEEVKKKYKENEPMINKKFHSWKDMMKNYNDNYHYDYGHKPGDMWFSKVTLTPEKEESKEESTEESTTVYSNDKASVHFYSTLANHSFNLPNNHEFTSNATIESVENGDTAKIKVVIETEIPVSDLEALINNLKDSKEEEELLDELKKRNIKGAIADLELTLSKLENKDNN